MLVRLRVGERREQPRPELLADPLHRCRRHALGDQQVGVERKVWAVLFDRPERLDEDAPVVEDAGDVGRPEFVEST